MPRAVEALTPSLSEQLLQRGASSVKPRVNFDGALEVYAGLRDVAVGEELARELVVDHRVEGLSAECGAAGSDRRVAVAGHAQGKAAAKRRAIATGMFFRALELTRGLTEALLVKRFESLLACARGDEA